MSQRESPVTDRVAGCAPALSAPIVPNSPRSTAPLDSALRRALGLPAESAGERPGRSLLSLKTLLTDLSTVLDWPAYSCPDATGDPLLTPRQAEAVGRPLTTPDLFLIQGAAGTGKSVVAARILREAVARGWRVLFLASTPAALDRALETLTGTPGGAAVRCLAEGETLDRLPPCVRQMTLAERLNAFETETIGSANRKVEHFENEIAGLPAVGVALDELAALLRAEQDVAERLDRLRDRREKVPASVEGTTPPEEISGPWRELEQTRGEIARQQAELAAQLTQCRQREEAHRAELAGLRPLVEARQAGRWWTPAYWRARGKGDVQTQAATLEQSCQELLDTALRAQQAADQLQSRLQDQTHCVLTALDQLRADLTAQSARLEAELTAWRERWQTAVQALPEGYRPTEAAPAALAQARQRLDEATFNLEQGRQAAVATRAGLEQAREGLAERLADAIPIVAATLDALPRAAHFALAPDAFDLLVLEEAEQTTEADFLAVAELARRWVLIGEPTRQPERPHDSPRRNGVARPQRPAHLRPGFFQRLWTRLHDDPSDRQVAWRQDLERLVCVLGTVAQEQERWIQPEPVVDRPNIVLHIYAPPRQAPRLVEVEFPAGTPIEDAKAFVFRELDELPLQTRSHCLAWEEAEDRVTVHLGGDLAGKSKLVVLGDGVVEVVNLLAGHWQTARLEFDRAAGWTRAKAVAWLRERLHLPGTDRTLLLDRSHRQSPPLASWLADLLDDGIRPNSTVLAPCVEFVTVPSLGDDHRGRRHDHGSRSGGGVATLAPKLKALRGGAGVEINLAEPRRHDLLPPELRDVLPTQGLVNYLEAQAVMRLVSELLNDPAARTEILAWQQARAESCKATADRCPPRTHTERIPGIAVLSPFPSQVQLLRHLLSTLPTGPIHIEVAHPDQMRHRECAVAVVSLTRSHSHRAVSYADSPAQFVLTLTRAAQRLILIGDPGTLLRRSQYCEAVDHLDEAESEQEQALAARLVRYLQGHGAQQRAFTIRELAGL